MFQLLESIRIENRTLHNIELHNQRFNVARHALYGHSDQIKLENIIEISANMSKHRYKCRVLTNGKTIQVYTEPYQQRKIKTLKVIVFNNIEYTYKTTNRTLLDKAFALRGECDDVIIVKNDKVTDAWASNLIFYDGENWVTPTHPLLKGTQREYHLTSGQIMEKTIHYADIKNFEKVRLINAMIDFDRAPEIDIKKGVLV